MTLFSQLSPVRIGETDARGHLTLPALAERLQELAWYHSVERGVDVPRLLERGVSWVLSRMRIDVAHWPQYGQPVRGETWVAAIDRFFYYRDFYLTDAQTGQPLVQASSVWGVLDVAARRVVPVPPFILAETPVCAKPPVVAQRPQTRLQPPAPVAHAVDVTVRWSDLDQNRHVNNTRYVAWLLDALPANILAEQQLALFDVQFRAEALLSQPLRSEVGPGGNAASPMERVQHAIRDVATDNVLVVAQSVWR